jgi:xylan 1,4-beta-xylosidase
MNDPMIVNPVLRGFNPDPSICRAGEDYYIVNSTFEWFPGVPIYHSRDLVNWRLIGHALTTPTLLDLTGVGDSCGIWAPSLSYHDGLFYLIYTIVRTRIGVFKDLKNYVTTSTDILGPWSEPLYLNGNGFDASLFHDDDGRKWLAGMEWDFRKDRPNFAGITLQEYDHAAGQLIGDSQTILWKKDLIEGPNFYQKDGWYYLMLAEGGTGWNHGISMARSRAIHGPYELDPQHSVMTSRDDPSFPLQKAGHGELVQTPSGVWYLVHLCSRPVGAERRCILGRETALQSCVWPENGWLRLASGGVQAQVQVPAPRELIPSSWPTKPDRDDFESSVLGPRWSALRVPIDASWASLTDRPGWLRLRGRESFHSLFEQSLLAWRLESVHSTVETCLEFTPTHYSQMAGLICWYDTSTHYYLRVTHEESLGIILGIVLTDDGVYNELADSQLVINDWQRCYLRAVWNGEILEFFASPDGEDWTSVGGPLDATKLSDDYGRGLRFSGAMVGICAQDIHEARATADFDYFLLKEELADEVI